jgi:phenylacetate-CoA ligase
VTTSHNALIGQVSQATFFRAMSWHGIDYAKTLFGWFGGDHNVDRWPEGTTRLAWGPHWDARSHQGKQHMLSRLDTVEQAVDFMIRHRPNYITGKPNAMLELAVETEARGEKIKLDAVISFSAQLTDATREACSRVFGAKVIDRYASKEVYDIAHQCPDTQNLHICVEAMIFEVLDEQDRPCPPGVPGRVIVTPFYNTVQPLIRYDLGDVVTLGDACSCGRALPVITQLNGRTIHLFRRPDGSRFSLRLPDLLRKTIGGREWQVAQTGLEQIEIRFTKIADAEQPAFDYIAQTIRSQMTQHTAVTFTPVAKLPATASGKVLEMVCEVDAQDTVS